MENLPRCNKRIGMERNRREQRGDSKGIEEEWYNGRKKWEGWEGKGTSERKKEKEEERKNKRGRIKRKRPRRRGKKESRKEREKLKSSKERH